jgi:hypothetical protein
MQIAPQVISSETVIPDADSRLREFAYQLAKTHEVIPVSARDVLEISHSTKTDLLNHLKIWELALRNANAIFKSVPANDAPVSRAGEWMLDNFYIVKQTLRQIEEDLPASFLDELPKLESGHPRPVLEPGLPRPVREPGLPRIFALAREWVDYSQSQIDLTQTVIFAKDYQQVTPLTIGELWALPIMLRIGILERLVFATSALTGLDAPKTLIETPSELSSPEVANETIVANCFLSLRLLAAIDWKDFFEQASRVEQILRADPAGVYADMDFDTRNSYRSVIEELARHSIFTEEQVALAAVELARGSPGSSTGRSVDDKLSARKMHLSTGYRSRGARSQYPLPAWIKRPHPPRVARVPHCHISGKHRYFFCAVYFGTADLRNAFGRIACSTHHRRCAWVGIGIGSRHHTRALECDAPRQAAKPAAHGFFGGHSSGQPHDGGRANFAGKRRRT